MDKMENKMDTQSPKAKAAGEYDYKMILAGAGCVAAMSTFGAYRAKWTNAEPETKRRMHCRVLQR